MMVTLTLRCSISCYLCFVVSLLTWNSVEGICSRQILRNGFSKVLSEGRIIRYKCSQGYKLIGPKYSSCVNGKWESDPPVCARPGCANFNTPQFSRKIFNLRSAAVTIECATDYILNGSKTLYCDGRKWVGIIPTCIPIDKEPSLFCDFDNDNLCGWSQDLTDNADWMQHNFNVPSRPVGTGPQFDHTFGDGFGGQYMYAESSIPRVVNDSARLLSPLYPASTSINGSCFVFWYHMFGATMGQLRVYQKEQGENITKLTPSFELNGDQGDEWRQGLFLLKPTLLSYQLVFESVRGPGYLSDIAIDDVSIATEENCTITTQPYESVSVAVADYGSCQYRCGNIERQVSGETPAVSRCDCDTSCESSRSCCHDYKQYCIPQGVTESMLPTLIIKGRTTPLNGIITALNGNTVTSTTTAGVTYKSMSTTSTSKTSMQATTTLIPSIVTKPPTTTPTIITNSTIKNNIITMTIQNTTIKNIHMTTAFPITLPINNTTRKFTTLPVRSTTFPTTTRSTSRITFPTKTTKTTRIPVYTLKTSPTVTPKITTPITKAPTRSTMASTARTRRPTTIITSPQKTPAEETAPVISEDSSGEVDTIPGLLLLISAILGATVLLLGGGAALFLVTRRRLITPWGRRRSQGHYSDDSDVRFLTASDGEVQLDFTLATSSN